MVRKDNMEVLIFIIGAIFGSFYLVWATRLPKNEDIIKSRSKCDICNHELKWYNLIPIFSYIFQKGRCPYCHNKINPENILVEIITGLLFLICYILYGISYNFFIGLVIISLLILIFISDFKYMVILDSTLVVASILVIIIKLYYLGLKPTLYSIICGIIIFLFMYLVQKIGNFIFKKESLGGGDIKLSFVIGLILNLRLSLITLIFSTFLTLPYAVAALILNKDHRFAYGPFLVGSLLMVFLESEKFKILFSFLFQ